jgi:TonB family protein
MTAPLPFANLLEELRRHDVAVGVREGELFYRLLARWRGESVWQLRDAIAALLGRDASEVALIRRLFDAFAVEPRQEPLPIPPPAHPVKKRARSLVVPILLALAGVGGAGWWAGTSRPAQATGGQGSGARPDLPDQAPSPPPPPPARTLPGRFLPASFREARWICLLFAITGAGALAGLSAWRRSEARASAFRALKEDRLAAVPGPQSFQIKIPPYRGWQADDLDDLATWLGRVVIDELPSRRLDVHHTVEATAARGLPILRFVPRTHLHPLVLLNDVTTETALWQRKIDALIDGLESRGVRFERWYFDGDAGAICLRPHGERFPLSTLLARAGEVALLVVSTGTGILEKDRTLAGWVRQLGQFPRRAWLHPIDDQGAWRPSLARTPLPVFPMTRAGLAGAARALGADVPETAFKRGDPARAVSARDVDELSELAALMPQGRPELIMSLRESFLPHVPEEAVLVLQQEHGAWGGGRLQWGRRERRAALAKLAASRAGREALARRRLADLLREKEPPVGSGAHLRWRLARAEQAAFLARREDVETLGKELAALYASGIVDETNDVLAILRHASGEAGGRARISRRLPSRRVASLARRQVNRANRAALRRAWPKPRPGDFFRALVLGLLAAAVGLAVRSPSARTIPNVERAYQLSMAGTTARAPKEPSVRRLQVRRGPVPGGTVTGTLNQDGRAFQAELALDHEIEVPAGHWYQFVGQMPSDGWGLSEPLWVPRDAPLLVVHFVHRESGLPADPWPFKISAAGSEEILASGKSGVPMLIDPKVLTPGAYVLLGAGDAIYLPVSEPFSIVAGEDIVLEFPVSVAQPQNLREIPRRLSERSIAKVFNRNQRQVQACFTKWLETEPGASGTVVVRFAVSGEGRVTGLGVVSSTVNSPVLERCVADRVRAWVFPESQEGRPESSYPFAFENPRTSAPPHDPMADAGEAGDDRGDTSVTEEEMPSEDAAAGAVGDRDASKKRSGGHSDGYASGRHSGGCTEATGTSPAAVLSLLAVILATHRRRSSARSAEVKGRWSTP